VPRRTASCPPHLKSPFNTIGPESHAIRLRRRVFTDWFLRIGLVLLLATGCAGPGPRLMTFRAVNDGGTGGPGLHRAFDVTGDGRIDYREHLDGTGRVTALGFATEGGREDRVALDAMSPRDVLIILDSVPFRLVEAAHAAGRFPWFYPPSASISPFPVMTDLSLNEFFDVSPSAGVESEYFDGTALVNGYDNYPTERNAPWLRYIDYHLPARLHGAAYMAPKDWFEHELAAIQRGIDRAPEGTFTAYCVSTSGIGARYGRRGHVWALDLLERFCQTLIYETRGRVRFTLMSDHGHAVQSSLRVPIGDWLRWCGFRVADRLRESDDVVVPEFGLVSCAVVYARRPAAVATALLGLEGVELVAFRGPSAVQVTVCDRTGQAIIESRGDQWRYQTIVGDPLRLAARVLPVQDRRSAGVDVTLSRDAWLQATADHIYPDPVWRLWHAFDGLVEHTPDVMVSFQPGYYAGSSLMTRFLKVEATHGALRAESSLGFVMSMAGPVQPIVPMAELRGQLAAIGFPWSSVNGDALRRGAAR